MQKLNHRLDKDITVSLVREVKENMSFLVDMGMPVDMAMQEGWRLTCELVSYHWTVGSAFGTIGNVFERLAQSRETFEGAVSSFKDGLPSLQEQL